MKSYLVGAFWMFMTCWGAYIAVKSSPGLAFFMGLISGALLVVFAVFAKYMDGEA